MVIFTLSECFAILFANQINSSGNLVTHVFFFRAQFRSPVGSELSKLPSLSSSSLSLNVGLHAVVEIVDELRQLLLALQPNRLKI